MQIGYYHSGGPLESVQRIARAEKAGFDSAWVGDHFAFWFPEEVYPETWSTLAAAAMLTKKIKLGSGVVDPFRRNAALIAQSAATLDLLSAGRGILGIGGGEPMNISPYGIEWDHPVTRLSEAIDVIRLLWKSSISSPVSYSGQFAKLNDAYLQTHPLRSKQMPIYVAGSTRKTLKIAGEKGDGWYAHVQTPKTYAEDLRVVLDSAKAVGKSPDDIEKVAWFLCAVDRDPEKAQQTVFLPAAMELILAYDKLDRLGYSKDIPDKLALKNILMNNPGIALLTEKAKTVPIEAVEATAIFGTSDQCISMFEKFGKAGAEHMVVLLLGNNLEDSFELFQNKVIPYLHDLDQT